MLRTLRTALASLSMLAVFAGAAGAAWLWQTDFDKIEIAVLPIAKNPSGGEVFMLTGAGGNLAVSTGTDGVALVDSQFLPLAGKIKAALERVAGEEVEAVRYLVNTHWHGDHTGGNPFFAHTRATTAIAHDNVRRRLSGDSSIAGRKLDSFDPTGLPDVTFADSLSLWVNGEEVRLYHFDAGHTDGDVVVHFTGSKVAHLGDLFFQIGFPFIDRDSGGSVRGVLANLDMLLTTLPAETKLIPGHGVATDVAELRTYRAMVADCLARVEKAVAEGKSLADLNAAGLLDDYADRYAWAFVDAERFLAILHTEVAGG